MAASGECYMALYMYDPRGVLCWIDHIGACDISARSCCPAVDFLDEINGATVPHFEVEVLK